MSEWRELAEWDWVQTGTGERLHAVAVAAGDDDAWIAYGTTECGRAGDIWIPGVFSRMAVPRCKRCCQRTGMPQGKGAPKNDDACRPVVEARIARLREEAKG